MKPTLFFALALCAALVVACNSSAPSTPSTDTQPSAEKQDAIPAQANPGEGQAAAPAQPAQPVKPTAPAASKASCGDFTTAQSATQFKIVYKVTSDVAAAAGPITMTQYIKASGTAAKTRTDMTVQGIETRSFYEDGIVTSCSNVMGSWTCTKIDTTQYQDPAGNAKSGCANAQSVERDGSMNVAGVTAECFKITNKDSTVRYCIGDGVPLYVQTTSKAGVNTVEAQSYSKSVSDSDFVQPKSSAGSGSTGLPGGYQLPPGVQLPS